MPNFTGVTARPRLRWRVGGVEGRDLRATAYDVAARRAPAPTRRPVARGGGPPARTAWPGPRRRSCARRRSTGSIPSSGAQRPRMSSTTSIPCGPPKPRNAVWEVLWVRATRPCDEHVRDPVGVVDVAQRPRQHRLAEVEAPAAVGGQRRLERGQPSVVVEADPPLRVEAVALAGHRHVVGAAQAQPHRPAGEDGPQRGDGREAVGLHLLAAEAAAHPQALHGDVVAVEAEHVRHDLLRLARVLRAALHEHLAALVDEGERGVGLEVEVLLARHLRDAAEDVGRTRQARLDVTARDDGPAALEVLGVDRLGQRHDRGERLVVDLDRGRADARGLEGVPQHPADGVPDEHHDVGEQRLVVLHAGVVGAGHVRRRSAPGRPPGRPAPRRCRPG